MSTARIMVVIGDRGVFDTKDVVVCVEVEMLRSSGYSYTPRTDSDDVKNSGSHSFKSPVVSALNS